MVNNYSTTNKEYTTLEVLEILKEDNNKVFFSNNKRFTWDIVINMTYSELEDYEPFMEKATIPEFDIRIIYKMGELINLWSNRVCSELYPDCKFCPFHCRCGDGDMCDTMGALRTCYNDRVKELL